MSKALRVADRDLPLGVLVDAVAILARRGAGKTYTGNVLVEEAIEHQVPTVVLDPTGVWWGLRSSADGKSEGYPVVILGGEHGDVALEPTAGRLIADLVVDQPGAYVIDVSGFESGGAQDRFATAFAERLYRRKATERSPLCLVIDEADSFVPQRPAPGQQTMLGAYEAIVRRGRSRGLGVVLISQRAAVVNKNVLTQCEVLIALQTTGTQDRAAILDWVKGRGSPEEVKALSDSLASLKIGEAWLWSPQMLQCFERIRVRRRRTFDSSATPKPGETKLDPTAYAPVNLETLGEAIRATIEKAKADDPKTLRAQVAQLERELETLSRDRVEVVIPDEHVKRLEVAVRDLLSVNSAMNDAVGHFVTTIRNDILDAVRRAPRRHAAPASPPTAVPSRAPTSFAGREKAASPGLDKSMRAILTVLAQHPDGRTHNQIALLTGYRPTASTISVALSKLRGLGYVTPNGKPTITDAGLHAIRGIGFGTLPRGPALLDYWRAHKSLGKAERAVLDVMVAEYPRELTHQEMCERTGYSPDASTVSVALSKLRKIELVEGWRAADDFMEAIA